MDASFLSGKNTSTTVDRSTTTSDLADRLASSPKEPQARSAENGSRSEPSPFEKVLRSESKEPRSESRNEQVGSRTEESRQAPVQVSKQATKQAPSKSGKPRTEDGSNETASALVNLFGQNPGLSGTPILNFLTGRVDRLEPAKIPQIVVSSDFVKNALGGGGVMEFMTTAQPVDSLLKNLGLDATVAGKLQAMGGNLEQTLTPRELFDTMGVDSSRVLTELEILRDRLPIDGFQPYMVRSAALRGQGQFVPDTARDAALSAGATDQSAGSPAEDENRRLALSAAFGAAAVAGGLTANNLVQQNATNSTVGTPGASTPAITVQPREGLRVGSGPKAEIAGFNGQTMGTSGFGGSSLNAQNLSMPETGLASSQSEANAASTGVSSGFASNAVGTSTGGIISGAHVDSPTSGTSNETLKAAGPKVRVVGNDPFADLGQKIAQSQASIAANIASSASRPGESASEGLPPELVAFDVRRLYGDGIQETPRFNLGIGAAGIGGDMNKNGNLQANGLAGAASLTNIMATGETTANPTLSLSTRVLSDRSQGSDPGQLDEAGQTFDLESVASTLNRTQNSFNKTQELKSSESSLSLGDWLESSRFTAGSASAGREFSGGESEKGSEERKFGSEESLMGDLRELGASVHDQKLARSSGEKFADVLGVDSNVMTSADRQQLLQKISDSATMMVREGGSSMRMALGTPELGKLDVAISLSHDRVDVRIMAANDQIRDLLNREIPKLRDSLGLQNLNLGSVEVGVGGGQHNFSNSGGFSHNGSNHQNGMGNWDGSGSSQFFRQNAEQVASDTRSITRRIPTAIQRMNQMPRLNDGRIQVFA